MLEVRTITKFTCAKANTKMTDALACTYAAFILDGKADAAQLAAITKAAGVNVSDAFAKNFAAYLAKNDVSKILKNVSFGGGAAAPAAAAPKAAAAAPAAAKKEEKKEEEDEEMGFGLFD